MLIIVRSRSKNAAPRTVVERVPRAWGYWGKDALAAYRGLLSIRQEDLKRARALGAELLRDPPVVVPLTDG